MQGVVSLFKHEVCYGCALSGRAAANLKESLGKVECSTIHRAIPELMGNFGANNENFDNAKVIIVDESTMIDGEIFLTLLKHVKTGTRLILMGDIKQLPPIGKCQIFHDIFFPSSLHIQTLQSLAVRMQTVEYLPIHSRLLRETLKEDIKYLIIFQTFQKQTTAWMR